MMRMIRLAGLMVASLACAAPVLANDWDHMTLFTFKHPVALPGVSLGSGTYRFIVPDAMDRQIVRVTNRSGTIVYGTFMTQPVSRPDATVDSALTFKESSPRLPTPVQAFYFADRRDGHLFVYKPAVRKVTAKTPAKRSKAASGADPDMRPTRRSR